MNLGKNLNHAETSKLLNVILKFDFLTFALKIVRKDILLNAPKNMIS